MKKTLLLLLILLFPLLAAAQDPTDPPVTKDMTTSFRLALQVGTSKIKDASGWGGCYEADIRYYVSRQWGLGVKYNQYSRTYSLSDFLRYYYGHYVHKVRFIGPSLSYRYQSPQKGHSVHASFGMGYMGSYYDRMGTTKSHSKGSTVGTFLEAGADLALCKNLSLGIAVSRYTGLVTEEETWNSKSHWTEQSDESLKNIALTIGLRLNL